MSNSSISKCVICVKNVDENSAKHLDIELDKQLGVIFFIRKFLKYPLIPGGGENETARDFLSSFLIKEGNPDNWVSFCPPCQIWVQDARELYRNVTELEAKLAFLRETVESKVVETYCCDNENFEDDRSLFETVRRAIFHEKRQPPIRLQSPFTEVNVKVGCNSEEQTERSTVFGATSCQLGSFTEDVDEFEEDTSNFEIIPVSKFEDEESESWTVLDPLNDSTEDTVNHQDTLPKLKKGQKKSPVELRTCPVCNQIFDRPSYMTRHLNGKHIKDLAYKCDLCGKGFNRKDTLDKHRKDNCPLRKGKNVSISANDPDNLRNSNKDQLQCTSHLIEIVKTELVNDSIDWIENDMDPLDITFSPVRTSGRQKSNVISRTCPVCQKVFDRPSLMNFHMESVHQNNGSHKCLICKIKFDRKDLYLAHKETHAGNESSTNSSRIDSTNTRDSSEDSSHSESNSSSSRKSQERLDQDEDSKNMDDLPQNNNDDDIRESSSYSDNSDTGSNISSKYEKKRKWKKSKLSNKKQNTIVGCHKAKTMDSRTCPVCKIVLESPSKMKMHLNIKHHRSILISNNMKRSTKLKNERRGSKKSPVELRTCPVCKLILTKPSKMAMHLNTKHERKRLFSCDICQKGFIRHDCLKKHKLTHLGFQERLALQSSTNNKECKNLEELDDTIENNVDSTILAPETCPICRKVFNGKLRLEGHLNSIHKKLEPYICEVCGKIFPFKDSLTIHSRIHRPDGCVRSKPRPFKCTYSGCDKAFRNRTLQMSHERIHSGAKDYLCIECGVSFRHKLSLQRHIVFKHLPSQKNHVCHLCGKAFISKSNLVQHLKSKSHGGSGFNKGSRSKKGKSKTRNELPLQTLSHETPLISNHPSESTSRSIIVPSISATDESVPLSLIAHENSVLGHYYHQQHPGFHLYDHNFVSSVNLQNEMQSNPMDFTNNHQ